MKPRAKAAPRRVLVVVDSLGWPHRAWVPGERIIPMSIDTRLVEYVRAPRKKVAK